ncbi:MAG: glycosyltransferase family 4 protein [Thermaerobacter sp.]|nr:glycosyltransferase family 4 protein [Thermaerobacter sp.]
MSTPGLWGPTDILMLSWEYPPNIVGGLAIHVAGLSRALARRGNFRVTVLTPGGHGRPHLVQEEGVRIVRLGSNPFKHLPHVQAAAEMNGAFLNLADNLVGPDTVIHAHDWMTAQAACALSVRHNLPLLATFHSSERGRSGHLFRPPSPDLQIQTLERELFFGAWRRVAPSTAMAQEINATYGDLATLVVPNGIDLPRPATYSRRVPGRLLFVGRLVQEKGLWHLLHALASLRAVRPQAHLIVVGVGPERSALHREALRLGLETSVEFLGQLPPDAVARQREVAEVAVVPSVYEPFGLVALEALAWGVPLVASDVGGLREFAEGAAVLVPPADSAGLAEALLRILADARLRQDLARRGIERARDYTWDRCAERTEAVYRDVAMERTAALVVGG